MKNNNINKDNNKDNRRKKRIIIYIISLVILFLLTLFGCKKCQDINNNNNKLINSLPKLNNEGYWIDQDNNKLTDNKSNYNNINAYEYYKEKDKNYNKSVSEFIKDYNSKDLKKFKVEFFNIDDTLYDSKEYNFLDNLEFPQDPILVGIRFKGWKLLNNDINKDILYTSNNKIIVDDNFKFKAIYIQGELPYKETYTVEFYVDNNLYKEFEVKKGNKIKEFEAPSKDGYLFLGWYDQFDNKFDFNREINQDLTIKAKYFSLNSYNNGVKKHDVNYLDEDGNIYQTIEVENFGKAHNIIGKAKVGYHFVRWLDNESLLPFDFDTQIVKTTNLKPEYEINKYTVQFAGAGINNLPDSFIDVPHGTTLVEPDVSAMNKVGYHFMNKYLDQHGNEFIFGTTQVTEDLTLTPVFEINKYTITFKSNADFDNIPDEITGVEHGSKVLKPVGYNLQCNVNGYELDGLYYTDSNGDEQEFKFNDTVVESDIEITIKKKIKRHTVTIEDHLGNKVSSAEYDHFTELTLPKFTTDYVYEYFYNGANSSEHYNEDKDANNFKYEVTKNITLKPKAHKKHIKFSLNDNDINVLQGGTIIPTKTIDVTTGQPVTLPTAKKDNYYRLKPIVWQYKDDGGVYHDYNETTYSSNFDTTVYLKDEDSIFDDVLLIDDSSDVVKIVGLKEEYSLINDYVLNIPSMINDKNVTEISNFRGKYNIIEVNLPETIIYIGYSCFMDNINLENINLEHSKVERIGVYAFSGCEKLNYIKLPSSCEIIQEGAFSFCENITLIDLSLTSVESISNEAFLECKKVTEIKLPANLKDIGTSAFEHCWELINLNIEHTTVENISKSAFDNCRKLGYIKLPNTCKTLGEKAFAQCNNATSIDLSLTSIESISDYAFNGCYGAAEIKLPTNLKSIREGVFSGCSHLTNLNLEHTNVEEIGENAFYRCEKLTKIILPNTCRTLGEKVFAQCMNATLIDLSLTSIENIPDEAFNTCKEATEIKLPHNLKTIGSSAFYYCIKLTELTIPGSVTTIDENAFTCSSAFNKIVYEGSKAQFLAIDKQPNWFNNISNVNPIIEFNDGTSCHYNDL